MHTQQVKNLFMGHMYEVQDIAAAPEAWPGAEHLFATCARSGDVKLWDVRSRAGAAAVTLACGREPLEAVVLAANRGSSSGGGGSSGGGSAAGVAGSSAAVASGSSNQLGSGMLAFAGGAGQCVWAWDLRNGSAQSLYQLSTGNLVVEALAWHESSSSLIASCESSYENRCVGAWVCCPAGMQAYRLVREWEAAAPGKLVCVLHVCVACAGHSSHHQVDAVPGWARHHTLCALGPLSCNPDAACTSHAAAVLQVW
jgi:hypothetical protein